MSTERLTHAYIVVCPVRDDGMRRARELAKKMLCSSDGERPCGVCRNCRKVEAGVHPDMITVERQPDSNGKLRQSIVVSQARAMSADAAILPNEADRKVYLVDEADSMNDSTQNALLKLLEEPPSAVSIILSCKSAEPLLQTVRSRCVELYYSGASSADEASLQRAEQFAELAFGDSDAAVFAFCEKLGGMSSNEASAFFDALGEQCVACLRKNDAQRERLARLSELSGRLGGYLRVNTGVRHIMGLLGVKTIAIRNEETP